jgi:energy-coupling factor transporter transmembrane protein EcfT
MVFILLALTALPLLSVVLFIAKIVLRLSFSVGKVLLVLFAVWVVVGLATGGLQQTLDHLGKPYISQDEQGVVRYTAAFSAGSIDAGDYVNESRLVRIEINCAFSKVDVHVPQNCIVRLVGRGFLTRQLIGEDGGFIAFGETDRVFGTGDTIVELVVNSGAASIRIIH